MPTAAVLFNRYPLTVNRYHYWTQLLAIIANYCFSQPQKEAQEPPPPRQPFSNR
jgi:hypothetical protein